MQRLRLYWVITLTVVLALVIAACAAPVAAPAGGEGGAASEGDAAAPASDEVIEIEYWQYNFEARITAMDQLIEQFQAENPSIRVIHNSDVPYDDFLDKIAASVPAGVGPDVVTLFYGWQIDWINSEYIVPLPEDAFPPAMVAEEFSPMVQASFFEGQLYTLPTAVRTLALFYNKDLMAEKGLDPENPPSTLDELMDQAVTCTEKDGETFATYGIVVDPGGQAHHWFREVLLRQFGQPPLDEENRTVLWNASEGGYQAWETLLSFERDLGVSRRDFENDYDAFLAGNACFHIDGSFRVGTLTNNAPDLNYGVAELPEHDGVQSTFGSYWTHGITQKAAADPARMAAAVKFLQFITSAEAGLQWVEIVGELPAQLAAASDAELLADEKLGAFAAGLPYAHATFFINEADDRQAIIDAYDAVILNDADPRAELDFAVETVQAMYDEFWAER
jgi:multiple sugar transport system substrate-binding protein